MKYIISLFIIMTLSGCSSLNPLSNFMPNDPGIEVNAAVGKNVEQEKSVIKVDSGKTTKQEADTISNDTAYAADKIEQITNEMPPWMFAVVIFLAGWAIPDYSVCAKAAKDLVKDSAVGTGKAIAAPFKGIANFILLLFNRERL